MPLTIPDGGLVWLDVETTGQNPKTARIVSLGIVNCKADGTVREWESLINPGVPIPAEATEVHGITDEMVAEAPRFHEQAAGVRTGLDRAAVIGAFNGRYDVKVLSAEFMRCHLPAWKPRALVDPYRMWQIVDPRTLGDACRRWLGREPRGAHGALPDTLDARDVALAILEAHPDLPRDAAALAEACFPRDPDAVDAEGKLQFNAEGHAVFTFGKLNGWTLEAAVRNDPGYLRWMLKPAQDFDDDLKNILRAALDRGEFPARPAPEDPVEETMRHDDPSSA